MGVLPFQCPWCAFTECSHEPDCPLLRLQRDLDAARSRHEATTRRIVELEAALADATKPVPPMGGG